MGDVPRSGNSDKGSDGGELTARREQPRSRLSVPKLDRCPPG